MKIKTTHIPNRAKDIFVQLYCEKKGGETSEHIYNATQSWLSLSLSKKRHFYNTLSTKSVVKKAQRIIRTKPFLRAKDLTNFRKRKRKTVRESNDDLQNEEPYPEFSTSDHNLLTQLEQIECVSTDISFVNNENINQDLPGSCGTGSGSSILEENESEYGNKETQNKLETSEAQEQQTSFINMSVIDEESNSNEKQTEHVMPTEPIVPIIKNGKELFELLKSRNGRSNVAYESLTVREKRFYGNAVCRIKKEFVTHYKAYLESLSSRQLFDYYQKIF